jgi:glycerol uptake facilitator-like aquaporin
MTLFRRLAAEGVGTALLLTVIVGSGVMGERLAMGNAAIALLANSVATDVPWFVVAQLAGATLATVFARWLIGPPARSIPQ